MPQQTLISLLDRVNDLKLLPRTGWLFAGVAQPESIADHTCAVALLTLLLAAEINHDLPAHQLDAPLDSGRALQIAIVHDLAESVLTDLPKRSSELIGESVKHDAEQRALERMLVDHPAREALLEYWHEYNAASSPEGRLVRDADKLEMIHQALCYEQAGNRNLHEFFRNHRWNFTLCESLYRALSNNRS